MITFARIALAAVLALAGCGRTGASADGDGADGAASDRTILLFAAASTSDVATAIARDFSARTGVRVEASFAGSSLLARQIMAGAPADVFISADEAWMDELAAAGAIRSETRIDLLENALVLVVERGRTFAIEPSPAFDVRSHLDRLDRVAVGDPAHVPAGRYARQALESLGWWDALAPHLVPTADVRAALRMVEIGEADAGIVYATDAARSDAVTVVATFPAETHDPIRYPAALTVAARADAAAFLEHLRGAEASAIFGAAGFRAIGATAESAP